MLFGGVEGMKLDKIIIKIGHLPAISNDNGTILYNFIVEHKISNVLEIGFFHGKSTIFMAAALDELGRGNILAIDLESAKGCRPSILDLSDAADLSRYVTPVFSKIGSQWEMRQLIRDNTADSICLPIFDFCFIDAFHSWDRAGMDFFLADKLLKPGGWILFDDLTWSFERSPSWRERPETGAMPDDFRRATQVGDVFELLVRQHSSYENFSVAGNWGWAQKKMSMEIPDS